MVFISPFSLSFVDYYICLPLFSLPLFSNEKKEKLSGCHERAKEREEDIKMKKRDGCDG